MLVIYTHLGYGGAQGRGGEGKVRCGTAYQASGSRADTALKIDTAAKVPMAVIMVAEAAPIPLS